MADIKEETLKLWSAVNQNRGEGNWDGAWTWLNILITNIRPRLPDAGKDLDEFFKSLKEKDTKAVTVINNETRELKPLDRNEIRAIRYWKLMEWRVKEMAKYVIDVLIENNLIPIGGD